MKMSGMIFLGVLLASPAFAGSSPNDNQQKGESPGTITLDPSGATGYNLDDGNSGYTANVTLPVNSNGSSLNITNRSSRTTTVSNVNSSMPNALSLPKDHSARFDFSNGRWNLRNGKVEKFDPNAPSGVVTVPPSYTQ